MQPWTIGIIVAAALLLLALALQRANPPRTPGIEGIEDEALTAAFDRISSWPQFRLLRYLLLRRIKRLKTGENLVDVGCGPGYLIQSLARRYPELDITGVDISEEIVARARARIAAAGITGGVSFRVGDAAQLPLKDESVDFIVSSLSLHHWPQPKLVFEEFFRVLRPGGRFLVFDLRRDSPRLVYAVIRTAQTLILPVALRRHGEPLGSFRASYTPAEIKGFVSPLLFPVCRVLGGPFYTFTWAEKPQLARSGVYNLRDVVQETVVEPGSHTIPAD